ncbi:hypothetical protein [Seonamhaeicola sp.]|uniref:hypothetical protein n=1 Tax=Seonamhaeicola sp. TaxID=1912245 RepID=UPI0026209722|nr:hypothetical protein [Seonamhaeicola sp.]
MKNLRPLILGIIIGALATYFFCPRQAGDDASTETVKVIKPKGVISVAEATALNDNWTQLRKSIIDSITESRVGKEDYRWAWWSIKDIEDYIAFSRHQTDSLGYSMNGLRMYLGVYGENTEQNKRGLTTMFIVPTISSTQKASMGLFNIAVQEGGGNCHDCLPMNNGTGGQGGYPQ